MKIPQKSSFSLTGTCAHQVTPVIIVLLLSFIVELHFYKQSIDFKSY